MKPDLRQTVKEWLIQEERFDGEVPEKDIQGDGVEFAYTFSTPDFTHIVFQPKGHDKVVLESPMEIDDNHQRLLYELLNEYERKELIWDLKMELLWKDTMFQILPDSDKPERFIFTRVLHGGNLNKSVFEDAIAELHKANLFLSWTLQRKEELVELR